MTRGRTRVLAAAAAGVAVVAVGAAVLSGGQGSGSAKPDRPVTVAARAPSRGCVVRPHACRYPSAAGTGVPAGTKLQPSGPLTITTPGTVVRGRDVRGEVVVAANGVTIVDTRVTVSNPTGAAVYIKPKVRGTVIRDSTLQGADPVRAPVQYGVLNAGWPPNSTTQVIGVRMTGCAECYSGPGTLRDSYLAVSGVIPGAHYEAVYYGGGAGPLTVHHNTLLNPRPQTAVVFAGTDFGPQQGLTITGNFMAGGGWMVYGGGDNAATRDVRIAGNRLSRRYFPRGGSFGVSAHMNWKRTIWTANVWDGTLRRAQG